MPCLVGCANDFRCGALKLPIDGDSMTPFVKLFFGVAGGVPEITVGNQSSPKWGNTAIVKSFEFGTSNGVGFKAEIVDTQGGAFHLFVEKLNKCMARASSEYNMIAEWGWIVVNCNGSKRIISSPPVHGIPTNCEVLFAEGKVKFTIESSDLMQHVFTSRHDEINGTDANRKSLKDAIRSLANGTEPKFQVKFLRIEKNGTTSEYSFKEGGFEGPKDVWDCDGQNKLATIQKWLEPFVTDRDKGIVGAWEATNSEPTLLLIEDPTIECNEAVDPCSTSVGTYIVGGGHCSPVISFTPQINWVGAFATLAAGGNTGGAASGETEKKTKHCANMQTPETGIQQSIPISRYAWNVHGPSNAVSETDFAQNKHDKANSLTNQVSLKPITAELRIQGDPSPEYISAPDYMPKTVSLVVINPFHLFGNGNGGCGDWLAQPGCNEILSNKSWKIAGCSHSIKEGSYVTTIQLMLASPGIQTEGGSFGGPGSNGYVPINAC